MAFNMLTTFRGYVFASMFLTAAVIGHAVYLKRFFYRSVIYLSKSKFALLAVGNMTLASVLLLWRLVQAVFLGQLRFREVERLHIRARDAIIECCFAISVFRENFDVNFVAFVMTLLLLKSLHWLSKDRIEFLEEQPLTPVRTHVRLVGLMSSLLALDIFLVQRFASMIFASHGPTMYVLFAFEYTIMVIELLSDVVKYMFLVIDRSMEGHWEEKNMYSFYVELLSDLCQLTAYVLFFAYVQYYYSFPFHIIREVWMTFTKFRRRCSDFLRYRRVVATMNDLFADATEEELVEGDRTCIICREEMETAKKLACGHLFHARCLQNWLKRQLSCPTCRAVIDVNNPARHSPNARNLNVNDPLNGLHINNPNNINPNMDFVVNANINNNGLAPQIQGGNVGDAGARLVNLANQWLNQVMVEARIGAAPGGNAGFPGGFRANLGGNNGANRAGPDANVGAGAGAEMRGDGGADTRGAARGARADTSTGQDPSAEQNPSTEAGQGAAEAAGASIRRRENEAPGEASRAGTGLRARAGEGRTDEEVSNRRLNQVPAVVAVEAIRRPDGTRIDRTQETDVGAAADSQDANAPNQQETPISQNGTNQQTLPQNVPHSNSLPNANLRGPNAIAHMQLRARRRGAWPSPYQPYPITQLANYAHPLAHNYPGAINPYMPVEAQMMAWNEQVRLATRQTNPGESANGSGSSMAQASGQMAQTSHEQRPDGGRTAQSTGPEGQGSGTNTARSVPGSQPEQSSTEGSSSLNTRQGESTGGGQGSIHATPLQERNRGNSDDLRSPGMEALQGSGNTIPLERLLAIQEQIEVLRSEVIDLILIATNDPAAPLPNDSGEDTNNDQTGRPVSEVHEDVGAPVRPSHATEERGSRD